MIYRYILTLALIFISSTSVFGQGSVPDFTLASNQLTIDGASIPMVSSIKKQGTQILWAQQVNGKEQTMSYAITGVSGYWDAGNNSGSLTYTLNQSGIQHTLTLTGNNGSITSVLTVFNTEGTEHYVFNITSIVYN